MPTEIQEKLDYIYNSHLLNNQPLPSTNEPFYRFLLDQNKNNKPKHLHASTPRYAGNYKDDVEDWLFMIKQGFISAKISDEDRLNAIVNFVSDLPLLIRVVKGFMKN